MTIARVKPGNWALNEGLTSSQMNQVDTNTTYAYDIRSGQTATVLSVATINTPGELHVGTGKIQCDGTTRIQLASRTITRVADYFSPTFTGADWTFQGTPHHLINVGTNKSAWQSLHIPDGATITEVAALIQGAAHGGSWPPATPNRIGLYEVSLAGGGSVLLGSFTQDSTASQAAYEAEHWLVMGSLSTVVDRTLKCYRLAFVTETGANAIAGQAFDGVRVKYTTTAYEED